MKRRNRDQGPAVNAPASGIPPWINQFGQPVWNNPWGQYRPNTQGFPAAPVAPAVPVAPVQPIAAPVAPALPLPAPVSRYAAPPPLELTPRPVGLAAATHQVTDDGRIEADDERIRSTIQYAKGYAKACKSLGIEIPEEMRERLKGHTAQKRNTVHRRVRRTVAAAAAVSAGAVGMNAAAAYFTSSGSGSGSASAGTVQPVTVTAGTTSTPLYPGGTGDVALTINNPNSFPLQLTTVSGGGAITADAGHAGCVTTGMSFTNQTGRSDSLPHGNTSVDLTGAASMSTASDNGCQGATFTIPVTATVKQP